MWLSLSGNNTVTLVVRASAGQYIENLIIKIISNRQYSYFMIISPITISIAMSFKITETDVLLLTSYYCLIYLIKS